MFYVYKIQNVINNKVYIGQTKNYKKRWTCHRYMLSHNKTENLDFQMDYNTYGLSNFQFTVLEECLTREEAILRETFYINEFGGIESDKVYNCQDCKGQNKLMVQHQNIKKTGLKRSDEFKNLMRIRMIENNPMKGNHHSEETRRKLSESHKGYKNSMYGLKGEKSPLYGRTLSEEQIEHLKKVNLGKRKYSAEFVEILKDDYNRLGSFKAVAELRNLNSISVSNLIKYGTPAKPDRYK